MINPDLATCRQSNTHYSINNMALVRPAIAAKLEADPNFRLKIHVEQLQQIRQVHAQVNPEGKSRLADFTVECSDPEFVLIMENLTLRRVLNIIAFCNPTTTLELRMDIGVSKNQIGCVDPFGACYVKCNSSGRNKNHLRYIKYPTGAKEDPVNNNTNVQFTPIEIKVEKHEPEQPAAKGARGRPRKLPKKPKEEIIKPAEVPPAPAQSLKEFFQTQIRPDPQLESPPIPSNNNTNAVVTEIEDNTITIEGQRFITEKEGENTVIVRRRTESRLDAKLQDMLGTNGLPSHKTKAGIKRLSWCEIHDPCMYCVEYVTGIVIFKQACKYRPKALKKNRPRAHGSDSSVQPQTITTSSDVIEANNGIPSREEVSDPNSPLLDQTAIEDNDQIQQEITENSANKDDNVPQGAPSTIVIVESTVNEMDQITADMELTTLEMTQYSTDNANGGDKINTTDDSLINQEEMAEIFKEIFPEYYANNNNDKANEEYNEINSMIYTNDQSGDIMPMEVETVPQVEENSSVMQQIDPAPQSQPMQVAESTPTSNEPITATVNQTPYNQTEMESELMAAQVEVQQQVTPMEVQTSDNKDLQSIGEDIVADTVTNNTDNADSIVYSENTGDTIKIGTNESIQSLSDVATDPGVANIASTELNTNTEDNGNGSNTVERTDEQFQNANIAAPQTETTQSSAEIVVESTQVEVTRVIESVNSDTPQVASSVSVETEGSVNPTTHTAQEQEQPPAEAAVEDLSSRQEPAKEDPVNIEETGRDLKEQTEDQPNENSNGNVTADNIDIVADEDLDLNEIVYDGEIVLKSDNEDDEDGPQEAPFIDFFCDESLADDEREEENDASEDNVIEDQPKETRKRKRRFSLESVVFRSVKQKVQHVTVKQESNGVHEKESSRNIRKDSQMSPIMRAIFSAKTQKTNNNNKNDNNNNNDSAVPRRLTRSVAKNSSNSSEVSIDSSPSKNTRKNNKRRASTQNETKVKKEAIDSPRVLIYNESMRGRAPLAKAEKRESKPKKEAKVKVDKKPFLQEEERSKYSDEDYMSINSDDDSVEYHVDKLSEDEYFVEEILEKKIEKGKTHYLIKWLGWPHSDNTWTPKEDISPDIIEIYEASPKERNPGDRNVLVYNLFWKYAFRRHVRYVKEHPEDPNYENCKDVDVADGLLDKFSMCNCYRVLDAGSIYFKEQVARMKLEEDEDDVTKQTIWMAFCYRLVNRLTTFEGFGRVPTSRKWPQFKKYLINIRSTGDPVFTNRHNVIGLENYLGVMDNLTSKIDALYEKFDRRKNSLQKCIEYAQTLPFIGPFFAQQICNDLVEEGIISSSNSWVCLGPGAKAGIRNIYPGIKNSELLDKAIQLQRNQRKAFTSLELDFPFYEGRDLSLIDIEHVLCEFQKYLRMLGKKSSKKNLRTKFKNVQKTRSRKSSTRNK